MKMLRMFSLVHFKRKHVQQLYIHTLSMKFSTLLWARVYVSLNGP